MIFLRRAKLSTRFLSNKKSLLSSSSSLSKLVFLKQQVGNNNLYNNNFQKQLSTTAVRTLSTTAVTREPIGIHKFNLSDDDLAIIKATLPLVADTGTQFTKHFYERMFKDHPELLNVFNQTNQAAGKQSTRLFRLVATAASCAVETGELPLEAIENTCQKHCALGVMPDAYPIVGEHILGTISDILTDDKKVLEAWKNVYLDILNAFTTREKEIYEEMMNTPGGWLGRRKFIMKRKEAVSSIITRFKFVPVDGEPTPIWKPGLYTTIWCPVNEEQVKDKVLSTPLSILEGKACPHASYAEQPRHYTLAVPRDPNDSGKSLSISVKREGVVSTILHEAKEGSEWDLSAPYGCFHLEGTEILWTENVDAPIIFLSGGVGITPVLAMLENIHTTRPVSWLHASQNGSKHAYGDRLRQLAAERSGKLQRRVWYSNPIPEIDGEPSGNDNNLARYHFKGLLNVKEYAETYGNDEKNGDSLLQLKNPKSQYFMCGPPSFMEDSKQSLIDLGVISSRIHYEGF